MAWYRTGTIALTNGSTAVTGTGTDFLTGAAVGEGLLAPDGKIYEIASIQSAVGLTLGSGYLGTNASGQSYAIIPSQSYIRDLASQAATLVNSYQTVKDNAGAGKFGDGSAAAPGISFVADTNTGIRRVGADSFALVAGGADKVTLTTTALSSLVPITVSGVAVPTISSADSLSNKTLSLATNTLNGTLAQFNAAITDADLVSSAQAADMSLAAISNSIHYGAIVRAIIYDTSKDSDGGAWRKRCSDKSWYTEALGGERWVGQASTVSVAWNLAGQTTGAVFQATSTAGPLTAGKFYTPTSSTTATEVFRGISREFPEQVAIVAEAARVVIYDLTQVGTPMWMVFSGASNNNMVRTSVSSAAMLNGVLAVGHSGQCLTQIKFCSDSGYLNYIATNFTGPYVSNIAARNAGAAYGTNGSAVIVNATVNDVALTVLDTAPIDPATGLPVPTIYAFTAGGVSRIADDGTVSSTATSSSVSAGWLDGDYVRALGQSGLVPAKYLVKATLPAGGASHLNGFWTDGVYSPSTIPPFPLNANGKAIKSAFGMSGGVALLKENPATPTKGMVSYITNAYNTGWMPGDIRGAYLADTTAETITAAELMPDSTLTAAGTWVLGTGFSISAGNLNYGGTGAIYEKSREYCAFVVGETYAITVNLTSLSASNISILVANSTGGTTIQTLGTITATGVTTYYYTALTNSATVIVQCNSATQTFAIDSISVKLADPDRSVKNAGLVINGTLTKTAVASGAGLVAYSGFSAANYLEQPYNANLDFGTGDFCVMGWVYCTSHGVSQTLMFRSVVPYVTNYIQLGKATDGTVYLATKGATTERVTAVSGLGIPLNTWCYITATRVSGVLSVFVNGVLSSTVTFAAEDVTSSGAVTRFGVSTAGTPAAILAGSLALWRISATAPTADQIAHIYRTELPLFQANAQCTLAGTSTAVTALAYDDVADTLHVGTSWGRSAFRDLLRVDSEATSTGAITALSANQGAVLTGGASSGRFYQPAMLLRDELRRKDEARKALGKTPVFFDYTATASQTAFVLPKGYTAKALYKNGTLMREATTGTYWSRSNDGFAETATLSVGASVSDWISVMATRNY